MNSRPDIKVGILTDGPPKLTVLDDRIRVANALIGDGFHWESNRAFEFEGRIEVLEKSQGHISIVNHLPLESYLESVVASEMKTDSPIEFLKAHAVISRSWAIRKINCKADQLQDKPADQFKPLISWEESDSHKDFDVCNDDHCQRYQGIASDSNPNGRKAVKDTIGEVLIDADDEVCDARFSKCCGGKTELFSTCWANKDYKYLQSIEDPWCDLSDMPQDERERFLDTILQNYDRTTRNFHDWTTRVRARDIKMNLRKIYGIDAGEVKSLRAAERGASGRIKKLEIECSRGNVVIGKELAIRRLLANDCLYSSWFEATRSGQWFTLKGRGWGHGVGLCQIGAARMAFNGKSYREILEYYYPGSKIKQLYE